MSYLSILNFIFIFFALVATEELFRRYPKLTLFTFLIIPTILLPYWMSGVIEDWFSWVKGFSIIIGIILLSLFNIKGFGNKKFDQWFVYTFLVINIGEAIIKDIAAGNIANFFNAAAGFLLIVTLRKINTIHIDTHGKNTGAYRKYRDLHWDGLTMSWIIGYTLWNWVFVYLNFTQDAIHHLAVLTAALAIAIIDRGRWFQARVITLGTYFILSVSILHSDSDLFGSSYNQALGFMAAAVTFWFMAIYSVIIIKSENEKRVTKL